MIVKDAKFVISAARPEQWPEDDLPEVVFSGKSNVGKSSLINALCNRKNLAYSGSSPGKTRLINFYEINDCIRMVEFAWLRIFKSLKTGIKRIQ